MKKYKCTKKSSHSLEDETIYLTAENHQSAFKQYIDILESFYSSTCMVDGVFYIQEKGWFFYKEPMIFTYRRNK